MRTLRTSSRALSLLAATALAAVAGVVGASSAQAAGIQAPAAHTHANAQTAHVIPFSGRGGVSGTVEANPLNVRGGPGTGYNLHGSLGYLSTVKIPCYEYGTNVTATWPNGQTYTTNVWDAIADGTGESNGLYVSDAWVNTNGNTATMVPACHNIAANPYNYPWPNVGPTTYIADGYGYYEGECTSFASWELRADYYPNSKSPDWLGNADQWTGISATSMPHVGDIAQWDPYRNGAGGNGHVAYVHTVNYDAGTIEVYEYNWLDSFNGYTGHRLSIRTISWSAPSRYLQF